MATRKYKFKHIAQSAGTHIGDAGELILDTATNTLKVSDGSTPGGITLNTDGSGSSDAEPDFEIKTSNFNATAGVRYAVDTSGNVVTATLPATPSTGDAIFFADGGGAFGTNNLTIARNSKTIMALTQDMTISNNNSSTGLLYTGSTWRIF
jgi:hypothetical protein